jgi:hypothetical protein
LIIQEEHENVRGKEKEENITNVRKRSEERKSKQK